MPIDDFVSISNQDPGYPVEDARLMSNQVKTDFRNRVALITGGAGGIGREIAKAFIRRGIRCILADMNEASLADACRELGPLAVPHRIDLTDSVSLSRLIERIETEFKRLDILVNNAAMTSTQRFEIRSPESISQELAINFISPLVTTRMLLPILRKSGDGRIISIVSLGGIFPLPETSIYSASKFGLRGAMLCLGLDGPRLGLKVSCVLPSATETPQLMREAFEGGNNLQFGEPPQQPSEVASEVDKMLDNPVLERYPRASESWLVRIAMLFPNRLPKVIPLFQKKGDRGHAKYVKSLWDRGLVEMRDGKAQLKPAHEILNETTRRP